MASTFSNPSTCPSPESVSIFDRTRNLNIPSVGSIQELRAVLSEAIHSWHQLKCSSSQHEIPYPIVSLQGDALNQWEHNEYMQFEIMGKDLQYTTVEGIIFVWGLSPQHERVATAVPSVISRQMTAFYTQLGLNSEAHMWWPGGSGEAETTHRQYDSSLQYCTSAKITPLLLIQVGYHNESSIFGMDIYASEIAEWLQVQNRCSDIISTARYLLNIKIFENNKRHDEDNQAWSFILVLYDLGRTFKVPLADHLFHFARKLPVKYNWNDHFPQHVQEHSLCRPRILNVFTFSSIPLHGENPKDALPEARHFVSMANERFASHQSSIPLTVLNDASGLTLDSNKQGDYMTIPASHFLRYSGIEVCDLNDKQREALHSSHIQKINHRDDAYYFHIPVSAIVNCMKIRK